MKKNYPNIPFSSLFFLCFLFSWSFKVSGRQIPRDSLVLQKNNLFKLNVMGLIMRSFSFEYERILNDRISLNMGVRFMPQGAIPLLSAFKGIVDDEETYRFLKDTKLGNFAFTPELRIYFGKKGGPLGFYLGPYVRFARYHLQNLEYSIDVVPPPAYQAYVEAYTKKIPLRGDANTITAGLSLGLQWALSKSVYLDWTIVGPSFGGIYGRLNGEASLNEMEQEALRQKLELLDFPLANTETEVDAEGASLKLSGPWAGVRTGLGVGMRF